MEIFNLPVATRVNKVIPKNSFDSYTTTKQRKKFSETVSRITWINKLAESTVNLSGRNIKEIQVFHFELKEHKKIDDLLEVVERAIPYNVIYIITFNELRYILTSYKHIHSLNEDRAVVEWLFKTSWQKEDETEYSLNLKENLDAVFLDFCKQLCEPVPTSINSLADLVAHESKRQKLEREISSLEAAIAKEVQFNKKVVLNINLQNCLLVYQQFTNLQ